MLEKHTGMRTEVQREQAVRLVKTVGPIWLLIVLIEADNIMWFQCHEIFGCFGLGSSWRRCFLLLGSWVSILLL